MKDLISIKIKDNQQLVSARDLYKGLGLKGRFNRWFKTNSELFTENEDFYKCTSSTVVNNGAIRELDDYLLTIEMAKQLAMMARTEKSKLYREYFLELERKWNSPDMIMHRALVISKNRVKLLEAKNNELENQKEELQSKISHDADDVLFSHAIRYSHHAIKIRELAAILTQNGFVIGQNQLYKLLRLEHYISKYSTLPIGDKVKRGYFRVVHGVKNDHAWSTTLVTPEGQKHIINKALRGVFDDSYQKVVAE